MFEGGKGVDRTRRNGLSFLELDLEVVRPVRRKGVGLCVAENIRVVMIFRRNDGEIYVVWGSGSGRRGPEEEAELYGARHFACTGESWCSNEGDRR